MLSKIYLPTLVGVLFALGIAARFAAAPSWAGPLFWGLALLAHVPAVLPVAAHGRLVPADIKRLNAYPEWIVPVVLLVSWVCGMSLYAAEWPLSALGLALIASISVCYGGVRAVNLMTTKLQSQVCQPAPSFHARASDLSATMLFQLRLAASLFSLGTLLWLDTSAHLTPWLFILPFTVTAAAAAIVAITWELEKRAKTEAAATISATLSRQLSAKPTPLAVYHAGTSKTQIQATVDLCSKLYDDGLPYVLIVREAKALGELAKLNPRHLWHAENLSAVAPCAQPGLETILYAHDTPKNSHFTRNTQFRHVLLTEFSDLQQYIRLPKNVALYTNIVAPSAAFALIWQTAHSGTIADRITTIDTRFLRPSHYCDKTPVLGIHIAPDGNQLHPDMSRIIQLGEAVHKSAAADLNLWFPPAVTAATNPIFANAFKDLSTTAPISGSDTPCFNLRDGTEAEMANDADIILTSDANNLDALLATQKPLIWIGDGPLPEGASGWDGAADTLPEALKTAYAAQRPNSRQHFHSLAALCGVTPINVPSAKEEATE